MGIARDRGLRTLLQPDHAPSRMGLEHEFRVFFGEEPADFRSLVHDLHLGQPNLDPADPNAYRLPSGAAVTCDGAEAEIALAPTRVGPGFTEELTLRASHERAALASRLPPRHRLVGCSTHLSVSVPDELTQPVCRLYATIFAPAMMLLMDGRDSPGLLIRPRPGRVELGGEFVEGDKLAAAALFAVGSVLACQTALSDGDLTRQRLPPELLVRVDPAVERFGWYVDRRAFGGDLYADGRSAELRSAKGGQLTAQDVLRGGWRAAREALADIASPEELRLVQAEVDGDRPLPCELAEHTPFGPEPASDGARSTRRPAPAAWGAALPQRSRQGFEMAPVMVTWHAVVFVLVSGRRTAFAAVPGSHLDAFLEALDAGLLDGEIADYLKRRPGGRRLDGPSQMMAPGLFDELGPRLALLPPELGRDGVPVAAVFQQQPWMSQGRRWSAWRRAFSPPRSGWAGEIP